jgi:hypothetical protein
MPVPEAADSAAPLEPDDESPTDESPADATPSDQTSSETPPSEMPGGAAPVDATPGRQAPWGGLPGVLTQRIRPAWRLPLLTYLACQLIYLFWWAAFYPGLMSYDSVTYLLHVTTGPWIDNHSVVYDSMVWLSLHATGGLGALTLAQTIAMSAALAYTVAALRRLGAPGRWIAVAALIVAALPATGTFMVFVWKDVPFSICASLLVPTVAQLLSVRRRPAWQHDPRVNRLITAIGLELLGMCLFRLNGFIVVAIAAVGLVLLLPGLRARIAAAAGAAICLTFLLNLVVYPAVGIQRTPTWLTYANSYADIAVAYADRPSTFTRADKQLMKEVAPLTSWAKSGNCYDSDWTTNISGFSSRTEKVSGQLVSLWLRVLRRTPDLVAGARICRGSIAWSIFPGPLKLDGRTLIALLTAPASNYQRVQGNPYSSAVRSQPLTRSAHKLAAFLWGVSRTPQLEWLLWRGATWCYISYLALWTFARRRRNWEILSLGAILVAQQLGIIVDNPSQLFRYMASPILIGIVLLPLLFVPRPTSPDKA